MISALTHDAVAYATTSNKNIEVRKASMQDIPALLDLINGYAAKGIMPAAHRVRAFGKHAGLLSGL